MADWPLLDENDKIKKDYLRLILQTSDQLFLPLLDELEARYNEFCGSSSNTPVADTEVGTEVINGRKHTVIVRANPDDLNKDTEDKESKKEKPETLASYFNQTSSLKDGFLDAILLGSDQSGPATISEFRGAEIARAVLDGELRPEDIPAEAAKGPTGRLSQDIIKQTEKYLANGNYQGFKYFAAQMAGGIFTGGAMAGKAIVKEVGKKLGEEASVGSFSKILTLTKKLIMRPLLEGGETGAIGSRFLSSDELMRRLNVSKQSFHKVKEEIIKSFPELRKKGINNPDIGTDGLGNIIFKDRKTGRVHVTDVPFKNFIFLD